MSDGGKLSGVIAPALTPFKDDLSPDTGRFIDNCQYLLANGCNGLAVFGTTSEANSMAAEEKMALLDALITSGVDPQVLMPGTGACSVTETAALTSHAVKSGCSGVLMLPPFYYKGIDDDGIFAHFDAVIQRVGDSALKIYLYHIPPQAVIGFSLDLIERLIEAYPDTVVGLKDSSGDWDNMKAILDRFPGFELFAGSEQFLLAVLRGGGAGTISAQANINAAGQRRLFDNWQTDEADALQEAVVALRTILTAGYPLVPMLKEIAAHYRGDPAWRQLRPPLVNMGAAQTKQLLDALAAHGFALPNLEPMALAGE